MVERPRHVVLVVLRRGRRRDVDELRPAGVVRGAVPRRLQELVGAEVRTGRVVRRVVAAALARAGAHEERIVVVGVHARGRDVGRAARAAASTSGAAPWWWSWSGSSSAWHSDRCRHPTGSPRRAPAARASAARAAWRCCSAVARTVLIWSPWAFTSASARLGVVPRSPERGALGIELGGGVFEVGDRDTVTLVESIRASRHGGRRRAGPRHRRPHRGRGRLACRPRPPAPG